MERGKTTSQSGGTLKVHHNQHDLPIVKSRTSSGTMDMAISFKEMHVLGSAANGTTSSGKSCMYLAAARLPSTALKRAPRTTC